VGGAGGSGAAGMARVGTGRCVRRFGGLRRKRTNASLPRSDRGCIDRRQPGRARRGCAPCRPPSWPWACCKAASIAHRKTAGRGRLPRSVAGCGSCADTTLHAGAGAACFGGLCMPVHPDGDAAPVPGCQTGATTSLTQPQRPQADAKAEAAPRNHPQIGDSAPIARERRRGSTRRAAAARGSGRPPSDLGPLDPAGLGAAPCLGVVATRGLPQPP
jgi:hypothetical protein